MLNQSLSMYKLLKILKSKLKMIRARKLLASISLQNDWDVVFLAPHLSPAGLSPVLTMKRKLWNISMGNQSFHEQRLFETSRNTFFQSNSDHFLQENGFDATNTPPVGCEWHYNITLIIMCQSDSQFWPHHRSPNLFELCCRSVTHLARHDWKWGSEPIFAVLQCKANSW